MLLLVYYVGFMLLANSATYFIGLVVERWWGSNTSLVVFLTLYFFSFWLVWVLAVWVTKPKGVSAKAAAAEGVPIAS